MTRGQRLRLLGFFCIVAGTFFTLQRMTALVWDDSPKLSAGRYEQQPAYWSSPSHLVQGMLRDAFARPTASGYRPLNQLQSISAMWLIGKCGVDPWPWYVGGGIVFGLLAVVVFLVAKRYTATEPGAYLAVFLLLFSTPMITGGWPVVCNCQATVPLTLCAGLLVYWQLVESGSRRLLWTLALITIFFLGPWVREFVGLLPIFVITEELRRKRRPTWIIGLACVGFIHALFPTALVKWLAFPELPLQPVFRLGSLGSVLQHKTTPGLGVDWVLTQLQTIKWDVPFHFLVLFPPCLMLLTFASLLVLRTGEAGEGARPMSDTRSRLKAIAHGTLVLGYVLVAIWFLTTTSRFTGLWFVLGVAIALFRVHVLLGLWFLVSFLPFLRAFTEQVHLAYALVPASIGVAGSIEFLFSRLRGAGLWRLGLRVAISAVLLLAVADHSLNLYSSFYVVHRINNGIFCMADWFTGHVPAKSIVVGNALHLEDIRFYSGNHIVPCWTVSAGLPVKANDLSDPAELERMLVRSKGNTPVYFLDVDFNYRADKVGYHSHKYVRQQSVEVEKCGMVHVVRARYPFLDPLKRWTPRQFMSFMGSPDLENDFYTGPAQNGAFFFREVYAEYHVYRVIGTRLLPPPSLAPVVLREEGYHQFNIVQQGSCFYAIPQGEGAFDQRKVRRSGYSAAFVASTLAGVRDKVARHVAGFTSLR
jgi:hypothetical protein